MKSLSFFGFLANFEQSGCWTPDTESAEVMFSVTVKNLEHSSHTITLSNGIFLEKNANFCKKMMTSAKLRGPRQ